MNFINYAEMAAFANEGMAETEITSSTSNGTTTTTIYAGSPFVKNEPATQPYATNANGDLLQDGGSVVSVETWKIRRTVITDNGTTTTVQNQWAEGAWADRATLTYKY